MRVVVTHPQVPFAHGGAEVLAERLTNELNARGHEAALVTVPFKWYPRERVLEHAFVWRMLDEAERLFAISRNVADRLRDSLGLEAEVVLPPPQDLDYRCETYGDFV